MILQIIGAFIAIYSFSVFIEGPKKYLWTCGLVAAAGWTAYLLAGECGCSTVMSSFISTLVIALISHIFARVFKVPGTLFLISGILPIVPGAGMYRSVYSMILGEPGMASIYLTETMEIAGVIALGIFVVDTIFRAASKGWVQTSLRYKETDDQQ